jgi:NAD(P)-dependent dehydrogenase (short-subunit alcohol dehydrogenase family)
MAKPDLSGKVIIVTGGSSGLGKESVLQLAKLNPRAIYLTARTAARGNAAISEIQKIVPQARDTLKFLQLDLGSLESVRHAVNTFLAQVDRLDLLMNNAGLMASPPSLTEDGYEVQFGSNYMGPALFTRLLMPIINKTAALPDSDTRVINLSSELFKQAPKEGMILEQCKTPLDNLSGLARYGHAKLGNHYHTLMLSRKYPATTFVSIHPGVVNTGLLDDLKTRRPWLGMFIGVLASIFLTDVHKGAQAQLWASTTTRDALRSGAFYNQHRKEFTEPVLCRVDDAQKLWDWTEAEFVAKGF